MFRSAGAAHRSADERYGNAVRVYQCPDCNAYHVTRVGIPKQLNTDPLIERLAVALLGRVAL